MSRPMLFGAVRKADRIQPLVEIKNKGCYQKQDIGQRAEHYGPPMRFPDPLPFRTLKTMRTAMFCEERRMLEAFGGEAFSSLLRGGWGAEGLRGGRRGGAVREVARRMGATQMRLKTSVRENASPRHVPNEMLTVTEVPGPWAVRRLRCRSRRSSPILRLRKPSARTPLATPTL